jgi:hypothetical protein
MRQKTFHCTRCGSLDGYRSRPQTFFERHILVLLLRRPVRCADCLHRCYMSVFVPVKDHEDPGVNRLAAA